MTIHNDLRVVMGLLGKATPGPWHYSEKGFSTKPTPMVYATGQDLNYIAMCRDFGNEGPTLNEENAQAITAAVNFLRQHGPALLARQEGADAPDAARYRWLKANFQADYCRSTSDYWRITGEHETPQELHIGNGELTLDYLVDAARSGGGG